MSVTGNIQVKGDFGNPSGTGLAKISAPGLTDEAHAAVETKLSTFHTALTTAQLTSTNKGEVAVTYGDDASAVKPGTNVNVDRKLVVTWNRESDATIHRMTIPGTPITSTGVEGQDAGERINDTGRTALASALNALYGYTDVVVLTGKVLQKS